MLIVRDLAFLKQNNSLHSHSSNFCRKFTANFIKKAKAVATLSNSVKEELRARYDIERATLQTVGSGIGSYFHSVEWHEREIIKEQFSEGCEYFVFSSNAHSQASFLSVLKAFSIFKKWQKSNMKLLVIGVFVEGFGKELDKLRSYKFKSEVFIKKEVSEGETGDIVAASYVFIFPSSYEAFPLPVLEAMACGVPVITSRNSSMIEIAGDTALYADPFNPVEIAEQMKKIYKDEQLRNKLVEEGRSKSKLYNWDNTSTLLWQVIQPVHSQ
ncbi:MAG: glycosyltransferase family 4 protein [Segetibacter sp.]